MVDLLSRLGNGAATLLFKQVPEGWIFRAPTPWIWGLRPHYLVSESQKAGITTIFGASYLTGWMLLAALLLLLLLTPPPFLFSVPGFPNDRFETWLLIFLVCSLLIGVVQNLYQCLALRTLLRSAPRTTQRITLTERLDAMAEGMKLNASAAILKISIGYLIFTDVLALVLFVFSVHQALAASAWEIFPLISAALLGGLAIYCFAMLRVLRAKLTARQTTA